MASWLAFRFLTMRSQAPVCISCAVMPLIHYMTSLMHRVNDPCVKLYDCCHLVLEACMHKVLDSDVGMFPINKQDLPSMIQSAQVTSPHPLVQMTSESLPPQGYAAPAPGAYPAPPPGAHPAPPPGAYPAPPPGAYMQPPPGAYPVPPAGYPGGPPVEYAAPAAYPVQYVQPQGVMVQAKAPLPGRWQHGICDCCADPGGCGQCCMTFCCPCITYGEIAEDAKNTGVPMAGNCGMAGVVYAGVLLFTGCQCILTMAARSELRRKYGIEGDGCADFCTSWCCECCTLIQMRNMQRQYPNL